MARPSGVGLRRPLRRERDGPPDSTRELHQEKERQDREHGDGQAGEPFPEVREREPDQIDQLRESGFYVREAGGDNQAEVARDEEDADGARDREGDTDAQV